VFHEAVNFAALYKLPVLFVCENNFFSTHLPLSMRQPVNSLCEKIGGYKIPCGNVYGNNVVTVYKAASELIDGIRQGAGAAFLECTTFRWRAHVGPWEDVDLGFRTKELVERWMNRCPIRMFEEVLMATSVISDVDRSALYERVEDAVEAAVQFGEQSPMPCEDLVCDGVFAPNP
jgi:pyruvate dehydrogenase E1 component alpha subunit